VGTRDGLNAVVNTIMNYEQTKIWEETIVAYFEGTNSVIARKE